MSSENTTTEQRRPDWAALAIAAVLAIVAAVIFIDVSRLTSTTGYSPVGPASVPYWIAFGLIGLAIWTVFAAFRRDFPARERQEFGPVAWVVAGLLAQMILIRFVGFSIATGLLFFRRTRLRCPSAAYQHSDRHRDLSRHLVPVCGRPAAFPSRRSAGKPAPLTWSQRVNP